MGRPRKLRKMATRFSPDEGDPLQDQLDQLRQKRAAARLAAAGVLQHQVLRLVSPAPASDAETDFHGPGGRPTTTGCDL
jgi:hypothetical protein